MEALTCPVPFPCVPRSRKVKLDEEEWVDPDQLESLVPDAGECLFSIPKVLPALILKYVHYQNMAEKISISSLKA